MQKVPFLTVFLFLIVSLSSLKTKPAGEKLAWISLQEAEARMKTDPRPILIDLYTDWCGWCKVMDKKTYTNASLIKYLNQKFHLVKLNAESTGDIVWKGKTYRFNQQYRTHEIAIALTKGDLSYPSTVFIPADNSEPQAISGMLEVKEMEMITTYFGEDQYGKVPFDEYAKKFKPSWKK